MTAERRQTRFDGLASSLRAAIALGAVLIWPFGAFATPHIVVNPHTGLAISGFDPVAYFAEAKARFGVPQLEYRCGGAIWRFGNEGNRAAFAQHPDIYMPRFGGYDPVAIARGVSVPGHPLIWLIAGQRLYLFYSEEARSAFVKQPERVIQAAEQKWPTVARTIAP